MILKELSQAIGVSGQEDAVRKIVLSAIKDHAGQIRVDALGSITAVQPGTDGANRPRVLVAAHMDEVGFMVTGFDSDGLIRFTNVGGLDERILPGLRVLVGDSHLPGAIIWTPIHKNRDQTVVKMNNLRIDIGATSKESARAAVKPGERIAFASRFLEIDGGMLRGKSFDNRVGCALLIDILQNGPYAVDVLAAFTVQEEIGLRGARVAAQFLEPDVALVLEGTTAHDLPDPTADPVDERVINPVCRLGHGPALTVMDRSMIVNPRLLNWLRGLGDTHNIPYQIKTALGGGTDGGVIHQSNSGVPTAVLSVPCRYIHSPTAYLHRDDYAATLALVQAALNDMAHGVLRG